MNAHVILPEVATVKWKLAEFLKSHDVSAYELGIKLGGATRMSHAYRLANVKSPPARIDFATMGEVIKALKDITGKPVTFDDLLEYDPTDETN